MNKKDITDILLMDDADFEKIRKRASYLLEKEKGGLTVRGLLGYTNICKNHCTYCGMSADVTGGARYRLGKAEFQTLIQAGRDMGLEEIFLIGGEDPHIGFEGVLSMVEAAKEAGYSFVSAAGGEFSKAEYVSLKAAGLNEYVLKFEMSRPESFNRHNPSTTFKKRMSGIENIKSSGLLLGSGNICGWPGQTIEELAEDILLMKELQVSWVPVIPYMPVPGTEMASLGGRGDLNWMKREIAVMRILLPECHITAQQPGRDLREGLGSISGNTDAVLSGADLLFIDLLPREKMDSFRVVERHMEKGLSAVKSVSQKSHMPLLMG